MHRGFTAAVTKEGGSPELISSDGEVIITMKNGLEYVLRFGGLVDVADEEAAAGGDAAKQAEKAASDATAKSGVHRYLFAMARFNETAVKKPELAELPELPAGAEAAPPAAGDANSSDAATDQAKADEAKTDETKAVEAQADVTKADETKADESKTDAAKAGENPAVEQIIAERKRIEAGNQMMLDEYQETLKKGQDNVKELNRRFGDWYFVVGNDVFTKIRLSREAVIKKKDDAATGDGRNANESIFGAPGDPLPGLLNLPGAGN
jgi:hypothetical protein